MASLGSVGADEAGGGVLAQNGHIGAVLADRAVEENDGDVASGVQDGLSHVGSAGVNDVDDQQVGTGSDSGLDLLQLLSLVLAGKLVVELDAGLVQLGVQLSADRAQIHVSLVVPENGNFSLCGLGGTAGCQAQNHSQGQNNCENLFHGYFLLIIYRQFYLPIFTNSLAFLFRKVKSFSCFCVMYFYLDIFNV